MGLTPLKTVETTIIRVDRNSGYMDVIRRDGKKKIRKLQMINIIFRCIYWRVKDITGPVKSKFCYCPATFLSRCF